MGPLEVIITDEELYGLRGPTEFVVPMILREKGFRLTWNAGYRGMFRGHWEIDPPYKVEDQPWNRARIYRQWPKP